MSVEWAVLASPVGDLGIAVDGLGLCAVRFGGADGRMGRAAPDDRLTVVMGQLREYFAGIRTEFALPTSVRTGSSFDHAVWAEIARIPYGETRSYGEIAVAVGDRLAARAVGAACNRNPLPIIVPCHRVVGADGTLGGFGGGLLRMVWLLQHEAKVFIENLA
ncbi:MAG: methylated-DNA--[protein]-cysteine S-methyltransferase [Micromonosporaceae bacterium]